MHWLVVRFRGERPVPTGGRSLSRDPALLRSSHAGSLCSAGHPGASGAAGGGEGEGAASAEAGGAAMAPGDLAVASAADYEPHKAARLRARARTGRAAS